MEDNIKRYFRNSKLYVWPAKKAVQIEIIDHFANLFEIGRTYSEIEVNDILLDNHSFNDPVFLRRELIDIGILSRTKDGREYWKNST